MNRGSGLARGLSNLGDRVRVIDQDGSVLGFMIVAAALQRAEKQNAELVVISDPDDEIKVVRIVQVRPMKLDKFS